MGPHFGIYANWEFQCGKEKAARGRLIDFSIGDSYANAFRRNAGRKNFRFVTSKRNASGAALLRQGFGGHPASRSGRLCNPAKRLGAKQDGGEGRTRTFEAIRRLIYSQLPLPLGTLPRPPASGTGRPSGGGPDHG